MIEQPGVLRRAGGGGRDRGVETAARLVRRASKDGATWITLPEFFTSGFGSGNDPALKDAHRPLHGGPTELLKQLARSAGGAVGGSFLAQRDKDTYNTYVLALADGRIFVHDKDTPSLGAEASNFIGGDDNPVGCVVIGEYDAPHGEYTYDYMGRSQIVDRQGRTIAVRERAMGEGVVVADVEVTRRQPSDELEDRFWIPDVPALYRRFFEENRPKGAKIYQEFTRRYRNRR